MREEQGVQGEVPGTYFLVREDTESEGQRSYPMHITFSPVPEN